MNPCPIFPKRHAPFLRQRLRHDMLDGIVPVANLVIYHVLNPADGRCPARAILQARKEIRAVLRPHLIHSFFYQRLNELRIIWEPCLARPSHQHIRNPLIVRYICIVRRNAAVQLNENLVQRVCWQIANQPAQDVRINHPQYAPHLLNWQDTFGIHLEHTKNERIRRCAFLPVDVCHDICQSRILDLRRIQKHLITSGRRSLPSH